MSRNRFQGRRAGRRAGAALLLLSDVVVIACDPGAASATVLRPDHVVVVVLQDRASDAIGNPIWDYLNGIAQTGLVYTNSHGVTHSSTPSGLALYSGSTQGLDGNNGRHHSFDFDTVPNLGKWMQNGGFTFSGYTESLPSNGSQVAQAGPIDEYTRNINPMAMFTALDDDDNPLPNPAVNKRFQAFSNISDANNFASLPTVSYVIPNNLNNAHGSNVAPPWAGSDDEENNDILRNLCDNWLAANIDAYLQWAKQNNSLLIITQDEERHVGGDSDTITTIVHGDEDLFNPGVNDLDVNHYDLLKTLLDMYGLPALTTNTASADGLFLDASGQLSPVPEPSAIALAPILALALRRRHRRTTER